MTHAQRDPSIYVEDILTCILRINAYVGDDTLEKFRADRKTQDAVVRNLEVIGEAVKRIPDELRKKYPEISWKPAAAMRDFLIHEYPELDIDAIWETVKNDLPEFQSALLVVCEREGWQIDSAKT
jgi:uncharacterized protein with HEPN domain